MQISTEPPAPGTLQGSLKVGIKWSCHCDVDLYAKSNTASDYLYFGLQDTPEGHYFKDFTSSTDAVNGLEYVQFNNVDASNMDVKVNLYSGSLDDGVVRGVVRAEFQNRVYEQPFEITDSKWSKIDIKTLLKLT